MKNKSKNLNIVFLDDDENYLNKIKRNERIRFIIQRILFSPLYFLYPDDKTNKQIKVLNFYHKKEYEKAIKLAKEYIISYPKDYRLKVYLAYCYNELKNKKKVLELIKELKELNPNDISILGLYFSNIKKKSFLSNFDNKKLGNFMTTPYYYDLTGSLLLKYREFDFLEPLIKKAKSNNVKWKEKSFYLSVIHEIKEEYELAYNELKKYFKKSFIFNKKIRKSLMEKMNYLKNKIENKSLPLTTTTPKGGKRKKRNERNFFGKIH